MKIPHSPPIAFFFGITNQFFSIAIVNITSMDINIKPAVIVAGIRKVRKTGNTIHAIAFTNPA